jgi:hypothetical protein
MKILHVWDCAGVSSILAKYQKKLGYDVKVLMRQSSDKLGISEFYGNTTDLTGREFIKTAVRLSKDYDVIHIHNLPNIIPMIRLRHPRKKIIIHYHGFPATDKKHVKFYSRFATNVFLATSDLKSVFPKGVVIPTIVDTDHFNGTPNGKGNLTFSIRYLDMNKFKQTVKEDVDIIDREKNHVPYKDMPEFLKSYSRYYDIKFLYGKLLEAHSKTCYEALACGLDVVDYTGCTLRGLPEQHEPHHVAEFCMKHYVT